MMVGGSSVFAGKLQYLLFIFDISTLLARGLFYSLPLLIKYQNKSPHWSARS